MKKEQNIPTFNVPIVNKNILNPEHFNHLYSKKDLTLSQKAADAVTKFTGSWMFIFIFAIFLIAWVFVNVYLLSQAGNKSFDPYPFIFLNLILAVITAVQAPVILMSQNREAEREKIRAHYDYAVNIKAEKEIRDIQKSIEDIKQIINKKK